MKAISAPRTGVDAADRAGFRPLRHPWLPDLPSPPLPAQRGEGARVRWRVPADLSQRRKHAALSRGANGCKGGDGLEGPLRDRVVCSRRDGAGGVSIWIGRGRYFEGDTIEEQSDHKGSSADLLACSTSRRPVISPITIPPAGSEKTWPSSEPLSKNKRPVRPIEQP